MMKDKIFKYDKKTLVACMLLTILIFFYFLFVGYNIYLVCLYNYKVLPNTYLQDYAIGEYSYDSLKKLINFIDKKQQDEEIIFSANGLEYKYKYSDVGINLDSDKIIKEIKDYQNSLNYTLKIQGINKSKKKVYNYKYIYDEKNLFEFFNKLKENVDCTKIDGHFEVSDKVSYVTGRDAFSLNVDESYKKFKKKLSSGFSSGEKIELIGSVDKAINNDSYAKVDTLVSTFTTEFDPYVYARAKNLYTALNYINGAIIEPGEVFSYYKYAGPFNKKGYVFYYEFVGNGVCQIATTAYNAALLGGLEIVKRYPHAAKSVYVAGGLDATVASYSSGWYVDMAFKNTYEYPIYVRAYANGKYAIVELWSNSDAKKGYTYSTESVQIGYRGYKSFLNVYKDGVWQEKRFIATTWYSKDS